MNYSLQNFRPEIDAIAGAGGDASRSRRFWNVTAPVHPFISSNGIWQSLDRRQPGADQRLTTGASQTTARVIQATRRALLGVSPLFAPWSARKPVRVGLP